MKRQRRRYLRVLSTPSKFRPAVSDIVAARVLVPAKTGRLWPMNTPSAKPANPYAPPRAEVGNTVAQHESELAGGATRFRAALFDGVIGAVMIGAPLFIGIDFDAMAANFFANAFSSTGMILAGLGTLALFSIPAYVVNKNG